MQYVFLSSESLITFASNHRSFLQILLETALLNVTDGTTQNKRTNSSHYHSVQLGFIWILLPVLHFCFHDFFSMLIVTVGGQLQAGLHQRSPMRQSLG